MASNSSNELKDKFDQYARFGKTEAQLKEKDIRIESKNIQKLMKDARIIDSKYTSQLLDNDIARVLGKLTSGGTYQKGIKTFELNGFTQLVQQIADSKKTDHATIIAQIASTSGPSLAHVTTTANKDVTDRMTDSSHYTGTHKERFDAEGHGKGKEGRVDDAKSSGYVGNYKGEGTYDKKH